MQKLRCLADLFSLPAPSIKEQKTRFSWPERYLNQQTSAATARIYSPAVLWVLDHRRSQGIPFHLENLFSPMDQPLQASLFLPKKPRKYSINVRTPEVLQPLRLEVLCPLLEPKHLPKKSEKRTKTWRHHPHWQPLDGAPSEHLVTPGYLLNLRLRDQGRTKKLQKCHILNLPLQNNRD